ncbi:MAG TPA: hypothetical protein PK586_08700 [Casimicrobium sp.]|nr:hypothetical protein [Casimicrobium sp.]
MTERNVWELETSAPVHRYYWVKVFVSDQSAAPSSVQVPVQNMKPVTHGVVPPPTPLWVGFVLNERIPASNTPNAEMAILETPPGTTLNDARAFLDASQVAQSWKEGALHMELLAIRIS